MITVIPRKTDNSESRERHPELHDTIFFDENGNIMEDGKYWLDNTHKVLICIWKGRIDSRGNPGTDKDAAGWAIQEVDGHTEFWMNGWPYNSDENMPAIITDYGTWEEYWGKDHKLKKIIQNDMVYESMSGVE